MTAADISFHYPPDLLALLIDTIPRLVRSKQDVLSFFQGAGVAAHVRIFTRGSARALIISDSGYTDPAIVQCRNALSQKVIALCHLEEIVKVLEIEGDLASVLRTKVQSAIIDREPYVSVR